MIDFPATGAGEPEKVPSRSPSSLLSYVNIMSGRHQIFLSVLGTLLALVAIAPLELQRRIINEAIEAADLRLLVIFGVLYLAAVLLQSTLKLALRLYRGAVGEDVMRGARRRIFHSQVGSGSSREDAHDGRSVSVFQTELEELGGFVAEGVSEFVVQGGTLIAVLGYMLIVEPALALISLAFFIPQMILIPPLQRVVSRLTRERTELVRGLGSEITDEDPKAEDRFRRELDEIRDNRINLHFFKNLSKGLVNLINHLAPLSVLTIGGWMVIEGQTTLGVVVAFLSGFERMADPVRQLMALYRQYDRARVKYHMVVDWKT